MLHKLAYKLLDTDRNDYGMFTVRIALGMFIFAHGAQKLFGLFGGNGYEATMGFFTTQMGLPVFIAFLVIIGEGLGSVLLMLGFKTRVMAFWIFSILVSAIYLVHWKNGWYDFELQFLGVMICIALIIRGGGAWSLDTVMKDMFASRQQKRKIM